MFKDTTLKKKKNKKEEDNTKKWKRISVSLNRFELDDVSDFKIINKLVLKLSVSKSISGIWCIVTKLFNY